MFKIYKRSNANCNVFMYNGQQVHARIEGRRIMWRAPVQTYRAGDIRFPEIVLAYKIGKKYCVSTIYNGREIAINVFDQADEASACYSYMSQ